jgi:hypothetical protein
VKHVFRSVDIGDVVVDMELISGVNHQSIATGFTLDIDLTSVEPESMPKYKAVFGNKRVEHSTDNQSVSELSNRDKVLLQRALVRRGARLSGLSHAHWAIADSFDSLTVCLSLIIIMSLYKRVLYLKSERQ